MVVVARHFLTSASGFGSFSEVIYGFLTIFDEFIDVNEPLESRSAPVLESILVLLRILSECAYSDWESTSKGIRGPVPPKYQVLQNVLNPLYSRNRVYSTLPDCIHHEVSSKSLKFFMRLKSSNKLAQAAAYVTKNVPIPKRDRDSLIDQIDYYAESILLYISAADWDSTYTLLREELMALKNPSDMSNSNLDLLSIVYLNSIRAQSLLRHIKHIIVNLKSVYKLLVCHFLQDSLQYWYQANGREIYQLDPGIIEISRQLFDYMFKESIDHRQPTLWRFLMMIIVLCPDGFSAFLDGTPKVSKKLASTLNRKAIFLTSANDLLVRSNLFADVSCATSAYISVAKAASSIAPFDKDQTHPTVQFAKSVYHVLRHVLFINTRQSQPFPDLDQLQPSFVSSYCFLMLENLKVDVLQLLQSSLSDIRFQYNIIRGLVGLRHLSTGTQLLSDILDDYSSKLMDFIAALAEAVYTHEKMPYSSDNDSSFGYIMHIQTLRLSLHLLLSHQSESSNFCDLPDNFSRAITRCSVSRNESLRETIALVLKDFLSRFSCEVFRDQELPFDRYHVVLAIFESIGVNIRKSAKTSLKFSFNSREFEKEVTIIARYWETRMFIIENFKFKEIANGDLSRLENLEDRAMLSEAVEEAMVVALCSPSTMLCKLALSNIRCLVQEALMLEDFESNDTSWSIMLNFHIYSELSTPTPFFTALSIQKRMYKLFQNIERPSLALIKAWRKIYDRWSLLNVDVDALEASHEKQKEWRSYSSVLASLLVPLINVDGSLKIPDNIHFKARQFLLDLINLMLSSSTFLSETSRDILSSNLNPSAYQYVLPRLITMLDDHIEKNSGQELLLVSQISVLLRPVLQRFRDEDEIYFSVDFGSLSLKLVRFLKDMGSSIEVVTVKIYVCQLLESIGNISNSLNLRYELKVRNELVQILVDWLEKSTSFQTISLSSNDKAELEKERSLRELSVQISTSLSTLLNGMIIQVPDDTHEKDVLITKHGIFSNIFSLFLRVLHRCRTDDDDKVSGYNILGEKIQFIRSKIILCLSYMLMANVDVGLRIAISLGYHEDLALRIVFLEIFKNILSQGTNLSPEFGLKKHYEEMIDVSYKL